MINEPKIYYGIALNNCNLEKDKYKAIDYLLLIIDAIYILFSILLLLITAIPIIVNLIKRKTDNINANIKSKINSPLMPIDDNSV